MHKRKPQSVGINYAGACNARCQHCCVSSAPKNNKRLHDGEIQAVIDDLMAHSDVYEVGFTGGEPLLHRERILKLIAKVTQAGKQATLTTNGFWAVTPASAAEVIRDLESVNLSHLTLSWDGFHAPYVSAQRMRNALNAAKCSQIPTILNMCVSREMDGFDLLEQLGDATLGIKVTRFPVVPCGAGKSIPQEALIQSPVESMDLHCPGFEIIYHHDGLVYPCCSPPIFDTDMTLGRVGEQSHEVFVRRVERNALLAAIQQLGLSWLRELMIKKNPRAKIANVHEAVSPCEVCCIMLSDAETLNLIANELIAAVTGRRV